MSVLDTTLCPPNRLPKIALNPSFHNRDDALLQDSFFLRLAYKDYRLFHELMTLNKVPARLVSMCEMEMLEAINNGWEDHERVISSTLQEKRSNVELRTED